MLHVDCEVRDDGLIFGHQVDDVCQLFAFVCSLLLEDTFTLSGAVVCGYLVIVVVRDVRWTSGLCRSVMVDMVALF